MVILNNMIQPSYSHSGTKLIGDEYVTNGGRVLGVVGLGKDLRTALDRAYGRIEHIDFEGMQYRTDIGAKLSNKLNTATAF